MERKRIISCRALDVAQGNRCAVVGKAVQKDDSGFFVVEDSSGKVVCLASDALLKQVSVGGMCRVVGMAIEKSELKAESVLMLGDFDEEMYGIFLGIRDKI